MGNNQNFKPFLAYSASAGSGKTFALSVRYISLLFMGESPANILAATFTNKAAAEMRQRVIDSLCNLAHNQPFLDAIIHQTDMSREELFAKQPDVLSRFLASSSYIVTLDSFFVSILRSASLELGLEPDFTIKEIANDRLEFNFLEQLQVQGLLSELVSLTIDIEDRRFEKIFDLMQKFYNSDPLLPRTTYTQINQFGIEQQIDTLRDKMQQLLQTSGASPTAINNFAPASTKALFSKSLFSKESLLEHRNYKKYAQSNPAIEDIFQELKTLLSQWAKAKESNVLHSIFQLYDYFKNAIISNAKSTATLSFDDLNYFTYRLLHESISREFLYFKIDSKFKHILLDEFQDTSTLQFLLLEPLMDEIFSGLGQSEFKSFFYVGDIKQSLYRFRGGVEELFHSVANRYNIEILQMDTNYRSSKNLVQAVNQWFEPVMTDYLPQKPAPWAGDGYVEVVESDEVISEAVKQAKRLMHLGVNVDDMAFLVSTNADGQMLQTKCKIAGIETLLKTSSSLKSMPKIASIVAMIEYLYVGDAIDAQPILNLTAKSLQEIDTSWFSKSATPLSAIHRLIIEFGYFDNDPNLLKLLEFASSFSDIAIFLEEFALSSIPVASASVHGAKIMTVHGSKGLEFDYVILLDRLKRANADRDSLIYDYDDELKINQILYRISGRENFDKRYKHALDNQKVLSSKDRLNMLYVATTRASKGMIAIRKPKESQFDQIGLSVISIGKLTPPPKQQPKQDPTPRKSVTISHYGTQEQTTPKQDKEIDYQAILFGTALHYTLEMLEDFNLKSLADAMISTTNRYGAQLSTQALNQIQERVTALINHQPFQSMLQGATITKEQSISYNGELKQIDLLLQYPTHNIVIDYKSSKKFAHKHQQQVHHYQKAITQITGKPTKAAIIYIEDKIDIVSLD